MARIVKGYVQARSLDKWDKTPFWPVAQVVTYRGHNDVEFTDIKVGDRTYTVCADTWYDIELGREVSEADVNSARFGSVAGPTI